MTSLSAEPLRKGAEKSKSPTSTGLTRAFRDFFRWYGIPPTELHEAMQSAAQLEGWIPPWQYEDQKQQKREAGKRSGSSRGGLSELRRSLVTIARSRLSPELRRSPYSGRAKEALRDMYKRMLDGDHEDSDIRVTVIRSLLTEQKRKTLQKVSEDTLVKDLQEIRRRHGIKSQVG